MPKLPKGMFKRSGRDTWYIRLHQGGRDRWVSLGDDFVQACRRAHELRNGIAPMAASRLTVAQASERWLESYVPTTRREKGQHTARQRSRDYLEPFMGHMLLERVSGDDVRGYRLWLERNTKLSPASVSHLLSDLRCLLNWCADSGALERSPFPRRVMPRLQERLPDRLSDEEADLLRGLPEPHGFVCRLALGTGLRWGELCRAEASDIERGFLAVSHTKSRKVRRVPLAQELLAEVRTRVGRLVPYATLSPGSFAAGIDPLSWTSSERRIRCPAWPRPVVAARGECSAMSFGPGPFASSLTRASRREQSPEIST
jgi:integrase